FLLAFLSLNTGDEKVILQLVPMGYIFSYKLSIINVYLIAYVIIHAFADNIGKIHRLIVPIYSIVLVALIILTIVIPMEYIKMADLLTMLTILIAMIISIIGLILTRASIQNYFGLILAAVAFINHFYWFGHMLQNNMKTLYYPF